MKKKTQKTVLTVGTIATLLGGVFAWVKIKKPKIKLPKFSGEDPIVEAARDL